MGLCVIFSVQFSKYDLYIWNLQFPPISGHRPSTSRILKNDVILMCQTTVPQLPVYGRHKKNFSSKKSILTRFGLLSLFQTFNHTSNSSQLAHTYIYTPTTHKLNICLDTHTHTQIYLFGCLAYQPL